MITLTREEIIKMAQDAGLCAQDGTSYCPLHYLEIFANLVAAAERERICEAIKSEDDYCVDNGDYMLDSDDCIAVARGTWVRPEFDLDDAAICVRGQG